MSKDLDVDIDLDADIDLDVESDIDTRNLDNVTMTQKPYHLLYMPILVT